MNEDDLGGYSPRKNNVLGTYGGRLLVRPVVLCGSVGRNRAGGEQRRQSVESLEGADVAQGSADEVKVSGVRGSRRIRDSSPRFRRTAPPIQLSGRCRVRRTKTERRSKVAPLSLYAFNPDAGKKKQTIKQLFKAKAGAWPNLGGNANLVPVVANGQVFVASNKQLQIFGWGGTNAHEEVRLSAGPSGCPTSRDRRDVGITSFAQADLAAEPSKPSSGAIAFMASMQKAMCSSRSNPRSAAPANDVFAVNAAGEGFVLHLFSDRLELRLRRAIFPA
jgi:hypothetical protein